MSKFETDRRQLGYEYVAEGWDEGFESSRRSPSSSRLRTSRRQREHRNGSGSGSGNRAASRHKNKPSRHRRDRTRDSDRSRDRDSERESFVFVDPEHERASLKRRLSRPNSITYGHGHGRARHARARSLCSLYPPSSDSGFSSNDSELDRDRDNTPHLVHRPLVKYYHDERFTRSTPKVYTTPWPGERQSVSRTTSRTASRPASRPPSRPVSRARTPDMAAMESRYYGLDGHGRRDRDRDGQRDRDRDGRRDRYERGFQLIEQPGRHSHSAPRLPVPMPPSVPMGYHEDLRYGMELMNLGGGRKALSGRSSSYGVDGRSRVGAGGVVRRKGVSLSPGRVDRAVSISNRPLHPQYVQVHALILTWSFHDLRTAPYTAPPSADYISLEDETQRLRGTLESYGYEVHEFLIPMQRSLEAVQSKLRQFTRLAAEDTLLIVYYHGHGSLDDDNELVFSSHEYPNDIQWSQAAAAELYKAMVTGEACLHRQSDRYHELTKKYERYRPVSEIKWDAIRPIVLGAACDLLLILDCCAAGGANLRHVNWQPPPAAEGFTKHLFAACGFESSTSDDMTAALCDVLDAWVPGEGLPRSDDDPNNKLAQPSVVSPFLTTKRLHLIMEDRLQKGSAGSQPIFKQLLPQDPEQYITLPNLRHVRVAERGRRGYFVE